MTKDLTFADKLLPNQHEYSRDYRGEDLADALFATICRSSGISEKYGALDLEQSERFTQEEMGSNPVSMRFIEILMHLAGTRRVLEIGSFIGVSAICFARALPADGAVVTIEKFAEFAAIARRNIERNGCAGKVTLLEGDAYDVLKGLPREPKFDMIFIDGNKERYYDYFRIAEDLLAPKGIVLVDDCFFHGDALNKAPGNAKGEGCKRFLDHAASRDDYVRLAMPLSNGIYLMIKR